MSTNTLLVIVSTIGALVLSIIAVCGLVYIATLDRAETQPVVTILSSILTAFVTAGAAVVTHYLSGTQEQQRIILNDTAKTTNQTHAS